MPPRWGGEGMEKPKILVESTKIDNYGPFKLYELNNFDFEENLDLQEDGGIYVFTTRSKNKDGKYNHNIHYVGKTIDFSNRFYHHHKAEELMKLKPNCLAIWACEDDKMDSIEKELIEKWKPELNIQNNDKK